jgi:RNA polymerase sigma-70 factor (ECF subfamily)
VAASDTLSEALTDAMHRDMLSDAERLVQQRVEPHTWQAYVAACAGSPSREIAQRMGMSTAAVYKAKSKVIRMIREEISMLLVGDD